MRKERWIRFKVLDGREFPNTPTPWMWAIIEVTVGELHQALRGLMRHSKLGTTVT